MKRFVTFFLAFILCACSTNNTIVVEHKNDGMKKDLAYTIDLNNEYIITNASVHDGVIDVQTQTNEYDSVRNYYIDLDTHKELKNYDATPYYFKDKFEIITLETENYKIISEYTRTNNGFNIHVYYNDNNKRNLLFEFDEDATIKSGYPIHGYMKDNKGYLIVCETTCFSIYEISNGNIEIMNQYPYFYQKDNYNFIGILENTNIFIYENNEQIMCVQDDHVFYADKEKDGYKLMNVDYQYGTIFVYNKDDEIRIIVDDKTYDLGYQADYLVREDVILSTCWFKETNARETKLIDRKTNKEYQFDHFVILDENHQILDNQFLFKNYSDGENYYSILSIEDKKAIAIDCDLSEKYEFVGSDEKHVVFMNRDLEKAEFYVIELVK